MAKYPNSGAIFPNEYKKKDTQPDFKGKINLDISLLKQLISESEDGETVDLRLSGWSRSGTRGDFMSISYDSYKPDRQNQSVATKPMLKPQPQPTVDDNDVPF